MERWQIDALEVDRPHPKVLSSDDEGRAIVLELPAGEKLGEHQVHERGWLLVVSGAIEITQPGADSVAGGAGLLAAFDPNERHEVAATEDSRLLLVLSPCPGDGRPSSLPA